MVFLSSPRSRGGESLFQLRMKWHGQRHDRQHEEVNALIALTSVVEITAPQVQVHPIP